jgi:hypothetical protein
MSPRSSPEDAPVGLYRKPRADLYTVMLVVALLALILATVFLYLESAMYGPTTRGAPSVQTGMLRERPSARRACDSLLSSSACLAGESRAVSG